MADAAQQLLQIMSIFATLFSAGCVYACWRAASGFLPMKKRLRDLEKTVADLESSFDSLLDSHKRLRSRAGMRELRAREEESPRNETKAQIRARIFGTKSGPEFARAQLESQK